MTSHLKTVDDDRHHHLTMPSGKKMERKRKKIMLECPRQIPEGILLFTLHFGK